MKYKSASVFISCSRRIISRKVRIQREQLTLCRLHMINRLQGCGELTAFDPEEMNGPCCDYFVL